MLAQLLCSGKTSDEVKCTQVPWKSIPKSEWDFECSKSIHRVMGKPYPPKNKGSCISGPPAHKLGTRRLVFIVQASDHWLCEIWSKALLIPLRAALYNMKINEDPWGSMNVTACRVREDVSVFWRPTPVGQGTNLTTWRLNSCCKTAAKAYHILETPCV